MLVHGRERERERIVYKRIDLHTKSILIYNCVSVYWNLSEHLCCILCSACMHVQIGTVRSVKIYQFEKSLF